jgi:tetratricopeptide (TPR) repeat protein
LSEAADRLSAAEALSATDSSVLAARQRVEQAVAARDAARARAQDLEEKLVAAEALFERRDLQGAMRLLTSAASLDPQHPRTLLLSRRVADAIKEQEVADAAERLRRTVDELLAAAEERLRMSDRQLADVTSAKQKIAQALELAPDHAGARALRITADEAFAALREAARVDTVIRNARNRFANGKHQSALRLLEALDASNPVVAEALRELRGQAAQTADATERTAAASLHDPERREAPKDAMAAEQGTTVFIPMGGTDAHERRTGESVRAPQLETIMQPWRWWVLIGAGLLLIAILVALVALWF